MASRIVVGVEGLQRLGGALDELHAATATPVTARRWWLQAWCEAFPAYRPVAVVVDDGGELAGAGLLAVRRRLGRLEVVAMGHGPSDQTRLPVRGPAAVDTLATGIEELVGRLPRPWQLHLTQLPVDDPVASELATRLPTAVVAAGAASPTTRFGPDRSLRAHVSRNHHQQVRRMLNRMSREGLEPTFDAIGRPEEVQAQLPEVEQVHRSRDRQLGRASRLDDPHHRAFFRRVVMEAATRGELELVTLRLGPQLAAYVLSFRDGSAHRMWSCRFDPAFERYGVGRVANDHALGRALADDRVTEFDWMKGEEEYKSSLATHVVPAEQLLAWSSPVAAAALDLPRRAKDRARPWVHAHEPLGQAADLLKRVRARRTVFGG